MGRVSQILAQPSPASIEGDAQFVRINCKAPKEKLQRGEISVGINTRLRKSDVEPRPGSVTPGFANAVDFGSILGAGFYSNPNGPEVILIATPNMVWQIADGTYPMPVAIPDGETLDTPCEFVQAFDKVILFRGLTRTPLEWDGLSAAGFEKIAMTTPDDTTKHLIPNAEYGQVFNFRLLVPVGNDQVDVSDVLDYTQFDPYMDNWRVNLGSADKLLRIFPFGVLGAIMLKARSVLLLAGFDNTNALNTASIVTINDQIGIAGRWAAIRVGADVHFLSRTGPGIYALNQVQINQITTQPTPISDPIEPVIRRINWAAADQIHAVALGELIYWFVPLDGASACNAALVYNSATGGWESAPDVWTDADGVERLSILRAFVMNYQGAPAIYAVDAANNQVVVLYVNGALTDQLASGEQEIDMTFEDRAYSRVGVLGYLFEARGFAELAQGEQMASGKDVRRSEIEVETWRPSIEVTLITDQVNDERLLTQNPIAFSRTRYQQFGAGTYDPSNVNDDFHKRGRDDYSVLPGDGIYPGTHGITPGLKQRHIVPFSIHAQAQWVSYRVRNREGYCCVKGLVSESSPRDRRLRRAA